MKRAARIDADLLGSFPLPPVAEDAGKEVRGRLLLIAGSRELAGAAVLAGEAALRSGAGKLQIATAQSVAASLAVALPESRVIAYPEAETGCISEEGIPILIRWAEAAQAIAVGCGLQPGPQLQALLAALLGCAAQVPLVLDAAALGDLPPLAKEVQAWPGGTILLPHQGEMGRLLGMERSNVGADPAASARHAAERYAAHVLIKGAPSHVVSPAGDAFFYPGGGVGLATSGSGDVLAGIAGGLCARGTDPLAALLWAVWLHGEAGRILSSRVGRIGFLAREIPGLVPGLLR